LVGSPRESGFCWTFAPAGRVIHRDYGRIYGRVIKTALRSVMQVIPLHPGDMLHVWGRLPGRGGDAVGCPTAAIAAALLSSPLGGVC
jgi:hypothetical protein